MSDSLAGAVALARANARYWPQIAPQARRELDGWRTRAEQIPDPRLRELALEKHREEHFNAQVAAVLATSAPREARPSCVSALVALEVLYDYLDGLSEQEGGGEEVYAPFTAIGHRGGGDADGADAPAPGHEPRLADRSLHDQNPGGAERPRQDPRRANTRQTGAAADRPQPDPGEADRRQTCRGADAPQQNPRKADRPQSGDNGYTRELSGYARQHTRQLPGWETVRPSAAAALERCAAAQTRIHALPQEGERQLQDWAAPLGGAVGLGWRELAAGAAASVLCAQALIAAAARSSTSSEQAAALDSYYLRVCALSTLLDAAGDRERDIAKGALNLATLYRDADELAAAAEALASEARERTRQLPDGGHHLMIVVGVVAYFGTVEGANTPYGRTVREAAWRPLAPLIGPTLAVIRAWRAAKRMGATQPPTSGR